MVASQLPSKDPAFSAADREIPGNNKGSVAISAAIRRIICSVVVRPTNLPWNLAPRQRTPAQGSEMDTRPAAGVAFSRPQSDGRMRMAGLDDILETTAAERLATGFEFTEGPLWHPDGFYYFVDIRKSLLYRLTPGGTPEIARSETGEGNGTTFDLAGRLV